jgi:hypothetical protein
VDHELTPKKKKKKKKKNPRNNLETRRKTLKRGHAFNPDQKGEGETK